MTPLALHPSSTRALEPAEQARLCATLAHSATARQVFDEMVKLLYNALEAAGFEDVGMFGNRVELPDGLQATRRFYDWLTAGSVYLRVRFQVLPAVGATTLTAQVLGNAVVRADGVKERPKLASMLVAHTTECLDLASAEDQEVAMFEHVRLSLSEQLRLTGAQAVQRLMQDATRALAP